MSAPFEKYVAQAAEALDPAAFDRTIDNHDGYTRQFRRDRATELGRRVLAVVGPLIQEDTRDRMVTAAAASLDRDGEGERWEATIVPCSACKAAAVGEVDLFEVLDQMADEEDDL